ncbi:ATP-binding protein [Streptomyces sp. NBC_00820]|uniref:ATP-binding protein n=1 Tax=Streptomyces sp. NBC_00820 TaxID=2975842 RepID=UPI002ED14A7D|nr:ATP-binding protein [Streptomyces sp. NBC_00820]
MNKGADPLEHHQDLVAHAENLGAIRQSIRSRLEDWGLKVIADEVVVCANELLTNVHDHAGSHECEMTLSRRRNRVRVVVSDGSSQMPALKLATSSEESGRGLTLIDRLSSAWGARRTDPGGKEVWFELSIPDESLAA